MLLLLLYDFCFVFVVFYCCLLCLIHQPFLEVAISVSNQHQSAQRHHVNYPTHFKMSQPTSNPTIQLVEIDSKDVSEHPENYNSFFHTALEAPDLPFPTETPQHFSRW